VGGASSEEEELCECCGRPVHTDAQKNDEQLTEEQFYSPSAENISPWPAGETAPASLQDSMAYLKKVRSGPCKHLLPPANPSPKTKCNKYYIATSEEKRDIESSWDIYRDKYYRKFKVKKGTTIAHRVPKSAGGCPTGPGNLMPLPPECEETEMTLTTLQTTAVQWHRRRLGK